MVNFSLSGDKIGNEYVKGLIDVQPIPFEVQYLVLDFFNHYIVL
jgi:hypothetical protein